MSTKYYGVPTNIGTAAIANAALLGVKLDIKTFVVGDGGGSYYEPTPDMTALRRETWRGNIASFEIDEKSPNVINVTAYIPADVGGFTVREMGVLDSKGRLIGVGNTPDAQIVKFEDGVTDESMLILSFAVTNPEVFEWYADPTVIIASKNDIEKHNASESAHPDIQALLDALKEITPIVKAYPLTIHVSDWQTSGEGGYYCDVNNEILQEVHHVEISFGMDSLEAAGVFGMSSEFEILDGKLRFRSDNIPDINLTGEYMVIAESGGTFITGASSLETITVSENESKEILEILKN